MTDYESEAVRTLFQGADLERVPASRDLIGPAVAWGNGRRRRDRWTAAAVGGAVAAAAVAGVVAMRPEDGGGTRAFVSARNTSTQSPATSTQSSVKPATPPTLPTLSGTIRQRQQQLLDALQPYLPVGDKIACQHVGPGDVCSMLWVTSPTGTSLAQWIPGTYGYQPAPADKKYNHPHQATAAIPLVSGLVRVAAGSVQVISYDTEAQDSIDDRSTLTDPTALTFHTAVYEFLPAGAAKPFSMELTELVRDVPFKPGAEMPDSHGVWGFNVTGPVLSPQQFANLAAAPIFAPVLQQLADLNQQATQAAQAASHTAPPTSSR